MLLKFFIFGIAMASAITGSFRILFFPSWQQKAQQTLKFLERQLLILYFRAQEVSAR